MNWIVQHRADLNRSGSFIWLGLNCCGQPKECEETKGIFKDHVNQISLLDNHRKDTTFIRRPKVLLAGEAVEGTAVGNVMS